MDRTELLKTAASPHLVASTKQANELLARLNAEISDLRLEVSELELRADLHLNELLKNGKGVELQKSNWKISEIYREWKNKAGLLSDVRAIRRNLERHANLLADQEKYTSKYQNKAFLT
jgi:hypothetical protein